MRKDETRTYVAMPDGFGVPGTASARPARSAANRGSQATGSTATRTDDGADRPTVSCPGAKLSVFAESPGQQSIELPGAGCCSEPWHGASGIAAVTAARHVAVDANATANASTNTRCRAAVTFGSIWVIFAPRPTQCQTRLRKRCSHDGTDAKSNWLRLRDGVGPFARKRILMSCSSPCAIP